MDVSIIIPAHNESEQIEPTLKAIHNVFGSKDHEIVVVCDACTDDTFEKAEPYADKIINVENKNIAKTRNDGAKIAKGELLLFIDADTRITAESINQSLTAISDPKVAVVGSYWKPNPDENVDHTDFFVGLVNWYAHLANVSPGAFIMCRRSQFIPFPEDATIEDVVFCKKMHRHGKVHLLDTNLTTSMRRLEKNGLWQTLIHYISWETVGIGMWAIFPYLLILLVIICTLIWACKK
jgi:glycosyltransferase involved in cell wall biosynthesis